MRIKGIVEEDFLNYKLPSMFIISCECDFKCCTEAGLDVGVCQNAPLAKEPSREISDDVIYAHFSRNPITKAVVIGGMEPFLQFDEVLSVIQTFRKNGEMCPFVIYTGYYPEEVQEEINRLKHNGEIIIKFGRFIPNRSKRYDDVLGIELSSDNQFAQCFS